MSSLKRETVTTSLFLLAAFLAPGAWLIVRIPSPEKAQLCFVLATLLCLVLVTLRLVPLRRPPRAAWIVAGLVVGAFLLALLTNAFPVQQLLYDLYGEMPGLLWLCYPVVFLLAAGIGLGPWIRPALRVAVIVGLLLTMVALWQRFMTPWVNVFGSSAFNVSALIPIPALALWLATVDRRAQIAWRLLALCAAIAIAVISYGLLGIFAVIALVTLIVALRPQLLGLPAGLRIGGRVALAALVVALVATLLPQISSLVVKRADLPGLGSTVGSRMEFSYGAEAMVAKRPLTGYGPAGYRFSAYRYLDSWLYGETGSIGSDPIAYSPPSPHSLPWEIATRLGVVGAAALLASAVLWVRAAHKEEEQSQGEEVPGGLADLRAACLIGAAAWLLSLFVTPMHFASGLLGAALAGLALARPAATGMEALSLPTAGKTIARILACAALVACAALFARQQFALASVPLLITEANSNNLEGLEQIARTVPADPLLERYILQERLMLTGSPRELQAQIQGIANAPAYLTDFAPNMTEFARIALDRTSALQSSDTAPAAALLDRASVGPVTPALLGERLHLALVAGDAARIARAKAATEEPRFNGKSAAELYAPIQAYLAR